MEMQPKVRGIKEDHHHRKMGKVTKVIKEAHLLKRTETHLKAREVKKDYLKKTPNTSLESMVPLKTNHKMSTKLLQ